MVAGGLPNCNLRSVEQYDLSSNSWTSMPQLIEERSQFSLVNLKGILLAIGGRSGDRNLLNSVERFDVNENKWELATSLLTTRSDFAATTLKVTSRLNKKFATGKTKYFHLIDVCLQHKVIVGGGCTNGNEISDSCEAFDIVTKTWKSIAPLNTMRRRAAAATIDNDVYVFGGVGRSCVTDNVEQYDEVADKWTALNAGLQVDRLGLAVACVNWSVYLLGGRNWLDFAIESTDCFKASSERCVIKARLPVACSDNAATSLSVPDEELFEGFFEIL